MAVVTKHYFQPDRESFRQAIEGAMPELTLGCGNPIIPSMDVVFRLRRVLEKLEGLTPDNCRQVGQEAMVLFFQFQLPNRV